MGGYPLGYPDIRQDFRGKGASASAGGYPLALAGIRQRITDIRNGLSATISNIDNNDLEASRSVLGNVCLEGQKAAKRKRAEEGAIDKIVLMQKELVQISRDRLASMRSATNDEAKEKDKKEEKEDDDEEAEDKEDEEEEDAEEEEEEVVVEEEVE
ncbi:uncharacterized protein PGTG_21669 [Puccinia graminis f. sp. tritici CRL 75-36-700-3]|uniref:Uncharacterized protein n=1 Tax=Puccinia graminis f. sp. tritici (strain CRL 75-36-700-3 / race SCCL) TaxID=418459 RepID=H6QSD2_PUCGT|nr:uncharacterized protein PGTG_21669 [Puccinia graminis f. sp. tritici CRL 75-36-700-3]EHS63660.1 hypothetical protein PGTG_21669 [Puccinia graminis f. sp. tritici CRL 75-36-700-3]